MWHPFCPRALFAISLTAPSSSWLDAWVDSREEKQLSETSKAIMSPSSQWETLDFEEVEKSLAKKLNDDDLYAVLSCIKEIVKRLKLTGCIDLTGRGLEPLQESSTLELIDLSLLKQQEDSSTRLESMMCHDTVVSILDRVISTPGCSLKYIQFPYDWTRAPNTRKMNFENSFMQHLHRLGIRRCSKCNNFIRGPNIFCCYSCLEPICINCEGLRNSTICGICKKRYCSRSGCNGFGRERCTQCHMTVCSGCKHNHMGRCSGCEAGHCNKCSRISGPLCRNCIEDDNDDLDWF